MGLGEEELEALAREGTKATKCSRRDIPVRVCCCVYDVGMGWDGLNHV